MRVREYNEFHFINNRYYGTKYDLGTMKTHTGYVVGVVCSHILQLLKSTRIPLK